MSWPVLIALLGTIFPAGIFVPAGSRAAPPPAVETSPAPAPTPETPAPSAVRADVPKVAATVATSAPPPTPTASRRMLPEVGALAGMGRSGGTGTGVASIELAVPLAGPWLMRVAAFGTGGHQQAIGTGQVVWSHWGASLSLTWRYRLASRWETELGAGALAAVRLIAGRDLMKAEGSTTFDPGMEGTVRLIRRLSWGGAWAQLGGAYWPRAQSVFLRDGSDAATLPAWDMAAGIGVRFHWGESSDGPPT